MMQKSRASSPSHWRQMNSQWSISAWLPAHFGSAAQAPPLHGGGGGDLGRFFFDFCFFLVFFLAAALALTMSPNTNPAPRMPAARSKPRRCDSRTSEELRIDRKSTRLNSSHSQISYAVFCLK